MSAVRLPVLRRRKFTMPASPTGTNTTLIPLAQFIDATGWGSGNLEVKLFAHTIPLNATVAVSVLQETFSAAEPDQLLQGASPVGSVSLTSTSGQYSYNVTSLVDISSSISVYLVVTTTAAVAAFYATLEIDLVGRSAAPAG